VQQLVLQLVLLEHRHSEVSLVAEVGEEEFFWVVEVVDF
jgi:hypothetical protein